MHDGTTPLLRSAIEVLFSHTCMVSFNALFLPGFHTILVKPPQVSIKCFLKHVYTIEVCAGCYHVHRAQTCEAPGMAPLPFMENFER
jgi:hypothetical protein